MPHMARMNTFSSPSRDMSSRLEALCVDSSPDLGPVRFEMNKVRPIGEMISPVMPQSGYRERSSRLKKLDEDKYALIDELISKLESSQQQLNQVHLDQDRETRQGLETEHVKETLQQEVNAMRSLLDRNSYVTVIIDGDSLTFTKDFLNKGERGGQEVAQSIHESVKRFALEVLPNMTLFKVHVKLFANLRTLSDTLTRAKSVETAATFESFLTGLLNSDIMVDIIDTGLVRGLTMRKIKEAYRHDFVNVHCHQIFLAAVANDDLNSLLEEDPDIPVHERVTLLRIQNLPSCDQFPHEISSIDLDVPMVRFSARTLMEPPPTKVAAPKLARIPSTSSTKTMNSGPGAPSAASTPQLTWAAMTAQPVVPKAGEPRPGVLTPVSINTPPPAKVTLVEISRNKYGQRVDPVDTTIPYQELQRIKKMKLCNIHYLIGKNECTGNCGHSHTYPLSKYEKSVLKEVARMTACHNKTECDDIACIYGHRCPQNKPDKEDCYYKDSCRFKNWGHGIDEKVVRVRNVK